MDFGLGLRARHPSFLSEHSRQAEAVGFNHIWLYDSPRCAEAYVAMPYCAMATSKAVIGMAVTNTETRDPTVIANSFATLAILTGDRVKFGIGLGDSAVKFIGRKPSTFDRFQERVRLIQSLLRGEAIQYNDRQIRLPAVPAEKPKLIIAADGPKTFAFAGAVGDGAIISPGGSPRFLRYAIQKIREGAIQAGRDPNELYICGWTHCVIGKTRQQAIDELIPEVGRTLVKAATRIPHEVFGSDEPMISAQLRRRFLEDVTRQTQEGDLAQTVYSALGDDLFRELTIVGTPDECVHKMAELNEVSGLSQLIVNVYSQDREFALKVLGNHIAAESS